MLSLPHDEEVGRRMKKVGQGQCKGVHQGRRGGGLGPDTRVRRAEQLQCMAMKCSAGVRRPASQVPQQASMAVGWGT